MFISVHYSLHFFRFRVPQLVLELLQVLEACPHLGSFQGLSGSAFQLYILWPTTTGYVSVCNSQQTYQFALQYCAVSHGI